MSIYRRMSCRIAAAAARLDQVSATGTVGPHVKTQNPITFFYLPQYRSACAVTKQHTGITVRPVCNTGKRFRPYNQNLFVQSGNNTLTLPPALPAAGRLWMDIYNPVFR